MICISLLVLKDGNIYRLKAVVRKDPQTEISKLHLRWFWNHSADEAFQAKVINNDAKPMDNDAPDWVPSQRGVTFTHDEVG